MPSIKNITLAAAGLIGMVTAFPQGGFVNGTTSYNGTTAGSTSGSGSTGSASNSTGSGSSAGAVSGSGPFSNGTTTGPVGSTNGTTANTADNSFFCPRLNAQLFVTPTSVSFLIECDTNHAGTIIDIEISLAKRQANRPENLGDCLDLCDETDNCVGTGFNVNTQVCTLFSEVGAGFTQVGSSFGTRVSSEAGTTVSAGGIATSTLYATSTVTIASCAPTVTDCPLNAGKTAVVLVATASTTYICPSATVVPVAPVACGCAYSVSTAAAYKSTVTSGSTVLVPVTSTVIAVPIPHETNYATTTCSAATGVVTNGVATNGVPTKGAVYSTGAITSTATVCNGNCPKSSGTATSSMAVFTGAAAQVKAGMGMGAVVAAAALLL